MWLHKMRHLRARAGTTASASSAVKSQLDICIGRMVVRDSIEVWIGKYTAMHGLLPSHVSNQELQFAQKKQPRALIFKENAHSGSGIASLPSNIFSHFFKRFFLDRKDVLRAFKFVMLASRSRHPRLHRKARH